MTGIVLRVHVEKGYGFLGAQGERDIFFHRSVVEGCEFDEQLEGRRVTFDTSETAKGARATYVRPVPEQAPGARR